MQVPRISNTFVWITFLGVAVGAVAFLLVSGNLSSPFADGVNVVSEDPNLTSLKETEGNSSAIPGDQNIGWIFDGEYGLWNLNGMGGPFTAGEKVFVLHPDGLSPSDAVPSTISQTVELPGNQRLTAVLKARNGGPDRGEGQCPDSRAVLSVRSLASSESLDESEVVRADLKTLKLDVSQFSGEQVELTASADMAGEGCSTWNEEFTRVSSLYIRTGLP